MNLLRQYGLFLLLGAPFLFPSGVPAADQPPAQPAPVLPPTALVARLADDSFAVREEAARQLVGLGRTAVPALQEGLKSQDREVRHRCAELLPLAQRSDVDLQLDTFVLKGADPKLPPLPGWKRFQELAGSDVSARLLYARLHREDKPLLDLMEKKPGELAGQALNRCQQLLQKYGRFNGNAPAPAATAEVAGLLLAANSAATVDQNLFNQLHNLFYQQVVRLEVKDNPALRRLAGRLLAGRTGDLSNISQTIYLANSLQLTEFIEGQLKPAARKHIEAANLADDLNKFQQAVYLASSLHLQDAIETRLKPAVRKLAESAIDPANVGKFQQVLSMVQQLQMEDTLDTVLKPAAFRLMQATAEQIGDQSKFWQARYVAQVLNLNEVFDAMVKPAASKLVAEAAENPGDINKFSQALYLAQSLNLQEAVEGVLRPAGRKLVLAALEQPGDLNKLSQAVNMVRRLDLQDLLNDTVKPVLRKQAAHLITKPGDLNQLSQLHNLAQNLQAQEIIQDCIKPALRTYLESVKDKPINATTAGQGLYLARSLQLKEAVPLALKAALSKDVQGYNRGNAIFYVGEFGTKEQVAQLEGLLGDTTVIGSAGINWTTVTAEVRDVALGVLLHVNGQNLADYEYPYFQMIQGIRPFQTSPSCLGFANAAGRESAFKKWKEWQAKQKK